jgi:hypothetical protein
MAERNRRDAPERMRTKNPMRLEANREKMAATLRAIGHKPSVLGGNGRGLTGPQAMLAAALGWPTELAVPTGMGRRSGYPTCYKLDVASPDAMIGIEVDGGSHQSPRAREKDEKKTAFLQQLGWTVLRFSNKEILRDLSACVATVASITSRSKETTTTSQTES